MSIPKLEKKGHGLSQMRQTCQTNLTGAEPISICYDSCECPPHPASTSPAAPSVPQRNNSPVRFPARMLSFSSGTTRVQRISPRRRGPVSYCPFCSHRGSFVARSLRMELSRPTTPILTNCSLLSPWNSDYPRLTESCRPQPSPVPLRRAPRIVPPRTVGHAGSKGGVLFQ